MISCLFPAIPDCKKPDSEAYEHVLETTKLQPNQIMFVDDKDENLSVAEFLKWKIFKFSKRLPAASVRKLTMLLE